MFSNDLQVLQIRIWSFQLHQNMVLFNNAALLTCMHSNQLSIIDGAIYIYKTILDIFYIKT